MHHGGKYVLQTNISKANSIIQRVNTNNDGHHTQPIWVNYSKRPQTTGPRFEEHLNCFLIGTFMWRSLTVLVTQRLKTNIAVIGVATVWWFAIQDGTQTLKHILTPSDSERFWRKSLIPSYLRIGLKRNSKRLREDFGGYLCPCKFCRLNRSWKDVQYCVSYRTDA